MYRNANKPGDRVTRGVYWVHHYQHRLAHLARVALEHFPTCARCGDKVRFSPAEVTVDEHAPFLRFDPDFLDSAVEIPLRKDVGASE
jgi:hypothetical protein